MWKRLFVKTPLAILFMAIGFTLVIPFIYWIITDESYIDKGIDYLESL